MPFYVLYAKDKPESLERRLEHYAAHRTFIERGAPEVAVVMSGPLQTDNGEAMIGSMIMLEASSRMAVERFVAEDPFTREGVWGEVSIARFYCRHVSGGSLPSSSSPAPTGRGGR